MRKRTHHALAFFVLCAYLIALWAALPTEPFAYADEIDKDNTIDTHQMPDSSFLYDTSIYDLAHANRALSETTIQTTGEVVGDAVRDVTTEGKSWITLSSLDPEHSGTVQVLLDNEDLELIDTYGRYGTEGTTLTVQGTFHLSCAIHGGSADIHADTVKATAPGKRTPDEFKTEDFVPGTLLVLAGLTLILVYHRMNERQR